MNYFKNILATFVLLASASIITANEQLDSQLAKAVYLGQGPAKVKELIDAGADVNMRIKGSGETWTPLIAITLADYDNVTENERETIARLLLEAGADSNAKFTSPNRPYMNGKTAFELAKELNKTGILRVFEKQEKL